ncbi:hypothetical protein B6N60_04257 [Richelia sinica FACHB-800]|jgi:hypothetical protein|uniref:Uncharacterized protein n=1 Tax=Richelia sinica FACHB-800 TaxID=1357546 RepID=A0A975Y6R1_9NOST|nr:hypothetical protein [Richelia sinica]MBD2666379.1 hypothetical protein [Richelia sinica FACHB-800]QXE25542.1 hypothetical protein B6N60_04257 [Richelia sinica FACHB-800]
MIPDPTWYYAQTWEKSHLAKEAIDVAITCMASAETAEPAIDATVKESLEKAQSEIQKALAAIIKTKEQI